MGVRYLFVGLSFLLLVGGAARASERALDLLDAPVSFTADFQLSGDKGTYHGTVWHVPGRERRDFATAQGGQSVILRRDDDSAYLLKPGGRWYVGLGFSAVGALAGGLDQLTVARVRQGRERVGGIAATRYKVTAQGPKGGGFAGLAWFSDDGVLLKAEGDLTEPGGRSSRVATALSNIRVGKVDATRFEVPAGWFGMDLRSVPSERVAQAIDSLRPLLEGRGTHQ